MSALFARLSISYLRGSAHLGPLHGGRGVGVGPASRAAAQFALVLG